MSVLTQMLLDSPLGVWPLDEVSGTTAFDASGNGKHGTYAGGVTLGQKVGPFTCPSFDGSNDTVTIPDTANVFTGSNFTVEAWFKTTTTSWHSLFAKYNILANNTKWNLRIRDTNRLTMYMDATSGAAVAQTSTTPNDGLWHQAVGTFSAGTTASIFLDGVFHGSGSNSSMYATSSGAQPLTIASYDGTIEFTPANIAYCAYFPAVLSATRIKAHYEAGIRGGVILG